MKQNNIYEGSEIIVVNDGSEDNTKQEAIKTEAIPRLCDTFSFTTSQTLAYMMNNLFVYYIDISYNKREGKTKVKLFTDSLKSMKYILEAGINYNPLKVYTLLSIVCIVLSIIGIIILNIFLWKTYLLDMRCFR